MATFDYNEVAQNAQDLIIEFGEPASLRRDEGALKDPSKPWLGTNYVEVGYETRAVLLPMSIKEKSLYPELTTAKDVRKMLLEAVQLSEEPKISDLILYKDEYWQIEAVKQLKPASTDVLWTLVVSQ